MGAPGTRRSNGTEHHDVTDDGKHTRKKRMTATTVVTLVGRSHGRPQPSTTTIQGHPPSGMSRKHDYRDRHRTQNGLGLPPPTPRPPGWGRSRVIRPASREEWATFSIFVPVESRFGRPVDRSSRHLWFPRSQCPNMPAAGVTQLIGRPPWRKSTQCARRGLPFAELE